MKIKSITIKNFKSIKELTIPFQSYGEGENASNTTILVGLNESGKSSILEATDVASNGFYQMPYDKISFKGSSDEDPIEVVYDCSQIDYKYLRGKIAENFKLHKSLIQHVSIRNIYFHVWLDKDDGGSFFESIVTKDKKFDENYSLITGLETVKKNMSNIIGEGNIKLIDSGVNASQFSIPTEGHFQNFIESEMEDFLLEKFPNILVWKPLPEYLITEKIDLNEFKYNTNISIPLKNIFLSAGYTTDEKIKTIIEKAQKNPDYHAELIDELSVSITKQLNSIWKEHKVNLKISINGDFCSVHVEDEDKKHKYYNMSQRSDGFKQFISLILILSTTNSKKALENNIIILDEPETHLHPSGVRYMRDELLKIGKNNHVIIATHSHYMIDATTPERHFIVSKQKMETKIEQVDKNASMLDDEVLAKAFGVNLFKELLPNNILFVEGGDDKAILSHILKFIGSSLSYSIKSAGGASKVYGSLSLLAHDDIGGVKVFALFDDDKEGRDAKNNILKRLKPYYTSDSIKTIRDLVSSLPKDATIEDLLPVEFVKEFFESEMNQEFLFENGKALINQVKNQCTTLRENKEQLEAKKLKLSKAFVEKFDTKELLESGAPLLIELANNLTLSMQNL